MFYDYIGTKEIYENVKPQFQGTCIYNVNDINNWIKTHQQQGDVYGNIIVTFVLMPDYTLCISDRHSEHVQCANRNPVLSAGEMTFEVNRKNMVQNIAQITNQSTGYCPSPASWKKLEKTLTSFNIEYPENFDPAYIFSYCVHCQSLKIIKDNHYFCAYCNNALPTDQVFQQQRAQYFKK